MSRKKSEITLRVHKKGCHSKHNTPQELIPVSEEIERLEFVNGSLGKSKWKPISSQHKNQIEMKGFDYNTKSFSAELYGESFQQKMFIRVDIPKEVGLLESKCLEIGIDVQVGKENCYYHEKLVEFYQEEIMRVVENFYGR